MSWRAYTCHEYYASSSRIAPSGHGGLLTSDDRCLCVHSQGVLRALKAQGAAEGSVRLLCSRAAAKTVEETLHAECLALCALESVKTGDALALGGGRELRFFATPTPRWPDLLCAFDSTTRLLLSSKLFCAHVATDEPTDEAVGAWDEYGEDWRHYFDCMLAPVARQAAAAMGRLDLKSESRVALRPSRMQKARSVVAGDLGMIWGWAKKAGLTKRDAPATFSHDATIAEQEDGTTKLGVAAIAPMHGPVVRAACAELVREYGKWAEARLADAEKGKLAVLYASAYGNTAALAQAIARGAIKSGVGVESLNCELMSSKEVAAAVADADAFVIGSPTLGGQMPTPVKEALGAILSDPATRTKPCGAFGSFGWSGEAVDELERRLLDAGYNMAFEPIRVRFRPTDKDLQVCEESGTDVGQAVRQKRRKQARTQVAGQKAARSAAGVEQAMGRVVGALCVLTARSRDGEASSGMLASWVSQASFAPPGLTVAVKKDRAVEAFCTKGMSFCLNVLGEGDAMEYIKVLSKPFAPGEDRFSGIEGVSEAENGCAVLPKAASVIECTVSKRMEAGDHWLVYATVNSGKVLSPKARTAVHHRKSGASY